MPAVQRHIRISRGTARRLLFGLTIAALLYRALLPAGYMMPLVGPAHAMPQLALCGATMDTQTHSDQPADAHHNARNCPFCATAAQTMLTAPPDLAAAAVPPAPFAPRRGYAAAITPPQPGTTPGPRAPPARLA